MGDFGRMLAQSIVDTFIACALVGVVVGVGLAFGVPWIWHVVAAHVSVTW